VTERITKYTARQEPNAADQLARRALQKVLSTAVLGVVLSPFRGLVAWRQVIQEQRAARSPLATLCRAFSAG